MISKGVGLKALESRQDLEEVLAQYLELGQDFISYFDVKRALYSEPEFLFPRRQEPCYYLWMELLSALLRHPNLNEFKQNFSDQILFFYFLTLNDDKQEDIDLLYSLRTQAIDHFFYCSIGIPSPVALFSSTLLSLKPMQHKKKKQPATSSN